MPALAEFEGEWRLDRRILSAAGEEVARFAGRAVFTPQGAALAYREEGLLQLAAQSLTAVRAYLWRQEGGRITVDFADGRPFHAFDPGGAPAAEHLCGADLYRVRYDFARWPDWRAEWRVSGPRKDYRMVSAYRRA